jgi:hypothetical protein
VTCDHCGGQGFSYDEDADAVCITCARPARPPLSDGLVVVHLRECRGCVRADERQAVLLQHGFAAGARISISSGLVEPRVGHQLPADRAPARLNTVLTDKNDAPPR